MHNAGHDLWLRMSHDQKDYILDNRDAKKNSVYSTVQAPNMYLAISEYCTKKTMQYLYKLKYTKKVISVLLCRQF